MTSLLGIVGALLGGFLGGLLFNISYEKIFSWQGLITAIIGALLVLWIYGIVAKKKA